jgi:hypothetical protein
MTNRTEEDAVPTTTDNTELIREGYGLFAAGDVEGVLARFSPEIVWSIPGPAAVAGEYRGHAGVGEFFAKVAATWDRLELRLEQLLEDGEMVVAVGTHEIERGGRTYEVPFAHAWRVRDGLAVSFREYSDTAYFERILAA